MEQTGKVISYFFFFGFLQAYKSSLYRFFYSSSFPWRAFVKNFLDYTQTKFPSFVFTRGKYSFILEVFGAVFASRQEEKNDLW